MPLSATPPAPRPGSEPPVPADDEPGGRILRAEEAWPGAVLRLVTLAPRGPQMQVLAPERDTLIVRLTGASGRFVWTDGAALHAGERMDPGRIAVCPGGGRLVTRKQAQGPCSVLCITFDSVGRIPRAHGDVEDPGLRERLLTIAAAIEAGTPIDRAAALRDVLSRLADLPAAPFEAVRRRGGLPAHVVRQVLAFMDARLAEPPTLAEMAAQAGLTPAHFCTGFRRATGLPPQRAFRERQLARASALLTRSEMEVTDIALACGFGSSSHFASAFRAASGMTASSFRRALRMQARAAPVPKAGEEPVLVAALADDPLPRVWSGPGHDMPQPPQQPGAAPRMPPGGAALIERPTVPAQPARRRPGGPPAGRPRAAALAESRGDPFALDELREGGIGLPGRPVRAAALPRPRPRLIARQDAGGRAAP